MDAIRESVRTGRVEVLDADLSKFFDTIPPRRRKGIAGAGGRASHRKLMQEVARRVSDGAILALIKAWLRAPIVEEENGQRKVTPNRQGTPPFGFAQGLELVETARRSHIAIAGEYLPQSPGPSG